MQWQARQHLKVSCSDFGGEYSNDNDDDDDDDDDGDDDNDVEEEDDHSNKKDNGIFLGLK